MPVRDGRKWDKIVCRASWAPWPPRDESPGPFEADGHLTAIVRDTPRHRKQWADVLNRMKGNWIKAGKYWNGQHQ